MRTSMWATLCATALALCVLNGCDSDTQIKTIEPTFGNVAGNDDVFIVGAGFKPGLTITFGKHEVKNVVIESPTRMRVKTPSGVEGKVDVVITRDDGKTFLVKNGFTYTHDTSPQKQVKE
jgi:hypothetical protein